MANLYIVEDGERQEDTDYIFTSSTPSRVVCEEYMVELLLSTTFTTPLVVILVTHTDGMNCECERHA